MNWERIKLEDLCISITDGDHQSLPLSEKGIPFIVISNINSINRIEFEKVRYVPIDYYKKLDKKRKPSKGDVLLTVKGSFGIPVYVDTDSPFVFQRDIAIFKCNETIEKTFMDLMNLANSMNQEEQRYAREGFNNDEELSLYDMLFREDLSKNDIKKLKEIAATLLQKIKVKISELDHWTDKQETKAAVDNLIRDTLWAELPECYDEMSISTYRQKIYEYVYTRYKVVA